MLKCVNSVATGQITRVRCDTCGRSVLMLHRVDGWTPFPRRWILSIHGELLCGSCRRGVERASVGVRYIEHAVRALKAAEGGE